MPPPAPTYDPPAGIPSDLLAERFGGPIKLIGLAMLIAIADLVMHRFVGAGLPLGPIRVAWIAGPIAAFGIVLGLYRAFASR